MSNITRVAARDLRVGMIATDGVAVASVTELPTNSYWRNVQGREIRVDWSDGETEYLDFTVVTNIATHSI